MDKNTRFCHICKETNPLLDYCQRCRSKLYKNNAQQQVWAWLLSAVLFYIPANIYPIMITNMLFQETKSNILQGIMSLWEQQSYFVAMIILLVSVIIPIGKMIVIFLLLISGQDRRQKYKVFYTIVEKIGRWSMVDVFVVVMLSVIIQIDNIISIVPGVAIVSFALSVVCSMIAIKYLSIRIFNEN